MSRKKKNGFIVQVGVTPEGKPVVSGLFDLYQTEGLPLDIIFSLCIEKGWVPSWPDIYKEALSSGMSHSRILSKFEESIDDSFGKEWSEVVIFRLDTMFKSQE